jgi:initiation factor 1A
MGKSSKKGRITGGQRQEINRRTVEAALNDEMEGILYGRVTKHLGEGHVQVVLENQKIGMAKIRNVLARRGSTPITEGDIVILSGRDFETLAADRMRYDLLGVMTRAEASRLEKAGKIPSWFINATDLSTVAKKDEGEDLFDYSTKGTGDLVEDDDADVDVDAI